MPIDERAVPAALRSRPRWVLWRLRRVRGRSKPTKFPYSAQTLSTASVDDPKTWSPFEVAFAALAEFPSRFDGIGFVFNGDGIAGIDLDDAIDLVGIRPWAFEIVQKLNSYAESSPSGTGLHVIAFGALPPGGRRRNGIEIYETGRFFTMTGRHVAGTPTTLERRDAELAAIHAQFIPAPRPSTVDTPTPVRHVELDDRDLLTRAMRAKNGAKFARLWHGDTSGYASPSEADLALCSHLAFWTGGDRGRIDRLFRRSALMRDKWNERRADRTIGSMTIDRAVRSTGTYSPSRRA